MKTGCSFSVTHCLSPVSSSIFISFLPFYFDWLWLVLLCSVVCQNEVSFIGILFSYSVTPYMYGLMMTAQTCSVFMTVGVSIHRYIGVCHPYKSVEWLPKKRVTTFIIGLLTFSVIFNTTRFFEVFWSSLRSTSFRSRFTSRMYATVPTSTTTCRPSNRLLSEWVISTGMSQSEDGTSSGPSRQIFFGWAYTIVMYVVPFTFLIALNSMVLSAVRRSRRMHMVSQCGAESEELSKKAERKERQTSIMLISIVLLFIACNTLAFVCNIMENMGADGAIYQTLVTFNNLLVGDLNMERLMGMFRLSSTRRATSACTCSSRTSTACCSATTCSVTGPAKANSLLVPFSTDTSAPSPSLFPQFLPLFLSSACPFFSSIFKNS